MKSRNLRWWIAYGIVTCILVATQLWFTDQFLDLEASERRAREESRRQEALRRGQRQLDTWLAPLIAREAARSPQEYSSYFVQNVVSPELSNRALDALTPSPLLTERSPFVRLHFEARPVPAKDDPGEMSIMACSPQVPIDETLKQHTLDMNLLLPTDIVTNEASLANAEQFLMNPATFERFQQSESLFREILGPQQADPVSRSIAAVSDDDRNPYNSRASNYAQAIHSNSWGSFSVPSPVAERVGPLVPFWTRREAAEPATEPSLLFLRRLGSRIGDRYQGLWVDWPRLEIALLAQLTEVGVVGRLEPVLDPGVVGPGMDKMLATLPVSLEVETPPPPIGTDADGHLELLGVTWAALAIALLASGVGLRSMLAFGERRTRFASAVTHELRTPLTTFQLYSELLADDMVQDPARRREYLETLRRESKRLSNLVENVLAYARLEEGRRSNRLESTTIGGLVDSVRSELERLADEAGMELHIDLPADPDAILVTNRDAVGQILINLVDNACKYAKSGQRIDLSISSRGDGHRVRVRDHGEGIPPELVRAIFAPFERAGRESGSIPGVGLGLSLCRQFALDLGGNLRHRPADPGAEFILDLP